MKKNFTTAKIAKKSNADSEIASNFLTFNLWEKGDKHRVYINDYKRRTIGYIDIDNRNELVIADRQGNTQDEIDFAVVTFMAEYIDEQNEQREPEDDAKASEVKAALLERVDNFKKQETKDKAVKLINDTAYPAEWWIEWESILLCGKLADAMRCVQYGSIEVKPYRDFTVPNGHN